MTKDEIYEYIKYEGVYNSNVKKRLNKLIKKYHPDRNKDKETIKVVLEVKKELENETVSYKKSNKEDKNIKTYDYNELSTLELINKLKRELNDLNKQIEKGYHDEFNLLKEYSDVDKVYKQLLLKIKIDKREIEKLKHITSLDKFVIFVIIILSILNIINFNLLNIFLLIFIIMFEILYIYFRFYNISNLKSDLEKIEKIIPDYKEQFKDIDEKLRKLKIDIFGIKKKSNKKVADIRYYEKTIKKKDKDEVLEKDIEYEKSRVKYK